MKNTPASVSSGSPFHPASIDAPTAPPIAPPMTNTALTGPRRLDLAADLVGSLRSGVGVASGSDAGWPTIGGTGA
jgi:hypothetical protein